MTMPKDKKLAALIAGSAGETEATLGWRMVAHHASPGAEQESQEVSETPHIFH